MVKSPDLMDYSNTGHFGPENSNIANLVIFLALGNSSGICSTGLETGCTPLFVIFVADGLIILYKIEGLARLIQFPDPHGIIKNWGLVENGPEISLILRFTIKLLRFPKRPTSKQL